MGNAHPSRSARILAYWQGTGNVFDDSTTVVSGHSFQLVTIIISALASSAVLTKLQEDLADGGAIEFDSRGGGDCVDGS
jgi:hypothetical protein